MLKVSATAIAAVLLTCAPVMAQQPRNCAPRHVVIDRLADRYGETVHAMGLAARGAVVEVFASDETGTWTITVTNPAGVTCLIASGQNYESVKEDLPPAGDPT